jgi:hypothetical protein
MTMTKTTSEMAYIAVTNGGFVDGACFTEAEDSAAWVQEMEQAGMTVKRVGRGEAKRLLFTILPGATGFGRMIVARRANGEVEAAGWDCAETRADAREWLGRGLTLEFVTKAQVEAIADPLHVFSTAAPIGDVLTHQQAQTALAGY